MRALRGLLMSYEQCFDARNLDDSALYTPCRDPQQEDSYKQIQHNQGVVEWVLDDIDDCEFELNTTESGELSGLALNINEIKTDREHHIPHLVQEFRTFIMDYNSKMKKARADANPLVCAALYGSAGTIKSMLNRIMEEMSQTDNRRKYFRKIEKEETCKFCFTSVRVLNQTVQLCLAKMCNSCHSMLNTKLE